MTQDALAQARSLLHDLTEAARTGAIIPARLAGQLEAIESLLAQAAEAPAAPAPQDADFDKEAFLKDQAYVMGHAVHELRTPMTSIRGYSDMLSNAAMGSLTDMQKQFVDTIRTNARRMESLLTDVSDMNKLRAGTLRTNVKMELFKNVAMMVEKLAQPVVEATGRALVLDVPQGLPLLNTDGELLARALYKLVENGLRYSERAGGEVRLSARGEGNRLLVQGRDDGFGIAPADLAQLGTLYFRSEDERVRAYKGSGLGVPVAYGILALLGATIAVESAPEHGTTFTIGLDGMS